MIATYLTVAEVSEYLKLPEETVYKYARAGRMPASKVGRYWRFERAKIDDWVNQNSNQGRRLFRVLVVDDDPSVRGLLSRWLMEAGCDVMAVAGGDEAIQMVRVQVFDLLLLDLMMPRPNGVETLSVVRGIRPELEVVLVTSYFDGKMMDEALEHGALTVLKKPVDRAALEALLSAHAVKVK